MTSRVTDAETTDSAWKSLYRVGGTAALIAAGLEIAAVLVSVVFFSTSGPAPTTVIGWFTLLRDDRLLGLFELGLLDIIAFVLLVPMFLALYVALRRASQSWMAIGTTFAFVGLAVYVGTENAFSMLSLSDQYAAATTDTQRFMLLAAGQAMLAIGGVGTGAYMAFFLVGVSALVISVVILQSDIFDKVTAYVGILAGVLTLAYCIGSVSVPAGGGPLVWASGLFEVIWIIMVGRRLFHLGRDISKEEVNQN